MSKELKNITNSVMDQIHYGKIKMKPRIYFVLGSILAFVGLVISMVTAIFLFGLVRFALRSRGLMSQMRIEKMISDFPWIIVLFAIIALIVGILIIRSYDFYYKRKPSIIILVFIVAIILAGWIIDKTGLNDMLIRRGPMKEIMRKHFQQNCIENNCNLKIKNGIK